MRALALASSLLLVVLAGCGDGADLEHVEPGAECTPACAQGQTCANGRCEPAQVCDSDADCPASRPLCDLASRGCVAEDPRCRACGEWQECVAGACVPLDGRCGADADCATGVCDLDANACTSHWCKPDCAEWQECSGHACVLAEGRCANEADCPGDAPICDPWHRCVAPPTTPAATLAYRGLIITSDDLREPFEELALLHTLAGVPTRVVTTSEICSGTACDRWHPARDTAKAMKAYLAAHPEVEIVVLGGDIEKVPSRSVHDSYENAVAGASFDQRFYTDYYFADLSEWDANGDGSYAEDGIDSPDYLPELGVTRVPVSTYAEAWDHVAKVRSYLSEYPLDRVQTALFLSNVATTFDLGIEIPFDGALYFEMDGRTLDIVPEHFEQTKLFAVPAPGIEKLTVPREFEELQRSHNLVVHAGHGYLDKLTVEFDGGNEFGSDLAGGLVNKQFPIFLSCACDAGTFSMKDSAGEHLVTNASGGAIGYLGNAATGLGLAGGSQLIDEFLREAFARPRVLVGEALRVAHDQLPSSDTIPVPVPFLGDVGVPVMDRDSYEWTQKAAVYLGDGLVPVWTDGSLGYAPSITVAKSPVGTGFSRLTFTLASASEGTLRVRVGSEFHNLAVNGREVSMTVRGSPARVVWGFFSPKTIAGFGEKAF